MKSNWQLSSVEDEAINNLSEICSINRAIAAVLCSRGFSEKKDVLNFLYPELSDLHSPYLLKGIDDGVARIKSAAENNENIAIFADSDLDGITSLTILNDMLTRIGITPSVIRYPRDKEGYGLTCSVIDEFKEAGIHLVITVDSGIRDIDEIRYGRELGIDFIVTDHHEPDDSLPDAVIINPKQSDCSYPFKNLAGVGVAFKFAQAVLSSYAAGSDTQYVLITRDNGIYDFAFVQRGLVKTGVRVKRDELIEFITSNIDPQDYIVFFHEEKGLSQVFTGLYEEIRVKSFNELASDIVSDSSKPVANELIKAFGIRIENCDNKIDLAVKLFLEFQMRSKTKLFTIFEEYLVLVTVGTIADIMPLSGENRQIVKYGLATLAKGSGHEGIVSLLGNSVVTSKSIGWDVAPVLNAPGRLGETDRTVEFFLEKDSEKLQELIQTVKRINRQRQKLVKEAITLINNDIKEGRTDTDGNFFFYINDSIRDGIAGLVANRIADEINKPVIIATGCDGEAMVKGSGRCPGSFNFLSHAVTASDLFERLGGHAQAFGFTANRDSIDSIVNHINQSIGEELVLDNRLFIDCSLDISEISSDFIENLSLLEPYGKGNDQPVFISRNVPVLSCSAFGTGGKHGKYNLHNNIQAIGWNLADAMADLYSKGAGLDLVYNLENNSYMNRLYPRLVILDIDVHK